MFGVSADDHPVDLRLKSQLLIFVVVDEPFRKSSAASSVLEKDEPDLSKSEYTMCYVRIDLKKLSNYPILSTWKNRRSGSSSERLLRVMFTRIHSISPMDSILSLPSS